MTTVKAGIIGFGYMGHFHLNKIRQLDGIEVKAAYDIRPEALTEALAERLEPIDSLEKFLKQDLDLILIATPNDVHVELAKAALAAGKHVMLEKPAAMNAAEFEGAMRCAKEAGKLLTVHQNRRWDVDYRVVKEVIGSGDIGAVTGIESKVLGERGVCFGWRADPKAGGGMLYDWAVHLLDQYLQLFEGHKVTRVSARLLSILTPAVDDFDDIELIFDNGVSAKVVISTFALQKQPRWFVYGDRGTLKLDDFSGKAGGMARIRQGISGFDRVTDTMGPTRTMAPLKPEQVEILALPEISEEPLEYHRNLRDAVTGKEKLYVAPEETLRVMKVMDAAFESARLGQSVFVDL